MVLNFNNLTQPVNITFSVDLQSSEVTYGEGLEEELAKIIKQEIDWEIRSNILKSEGWIPVRVEYTDDAIIAWCQLNVKGRYEFFDRNWLFQQEKDAMLFILTWC